MIAKIEKEIKEEDKSIQISTVLPLIKELKKLEKCGKDLVDILKVDLKPLD